MPNPLIVRDAHFILLTYSQADDDSLPTQIVSLLGELGGECIVCRELHSDGGVHWHVLCEFEQPFSTRNARKFDCGGFHPNIKKVTRGTEESVWDYVTKDGDVVAGGLERPTNNSRSSHRGSVWEGEYTSKWAYIVDSPTKDEFYSRLAREDPRSLACSYASIAKYADWKYREIPEEYCSPPDFQFKLDSYGRLKEWLETYLCDNCTLDR